jgi:hypothetical protein
MSQIFRKSGSGVYLDENMKQELASFLIGKVRSGNNKLEEFEQRYEERGNRYCELSKQIRDTEDTNFQMKSENEKFKQELDLYKSQV